MRLPLAIARIAGLAVASSVCTGCWGPILIRNDPLNSPVALRTITPDGYLELADGSRERLAYIRMAPPEEQDSERWKIAKRRVGKWVELQDAEASEGSVAYYRQQNYFCGNEFMFPHPLTIFHFKKQYSRGCVNDLLMHLELAEKPTNDASEQKDPS
ncbi:MAG: hypothetical protein ACE5I3_03480 [Phycisphaerae bacterium]